MTPLKQLLRFGNCVFLARRFMWCWDLGRTSPQVDHSNYGGAFVWVTNLTSAMREAHIRKLIAHLLGQSVNVRGLRGGLARAAEDCVPPLLPLEHGSLLPVVYVWSYVGLCVPVVHGRTATTPRRRVGGQVMLGCHADDGAGARPAGGCR